MKPELKSWLLTGPPWVQYRTRIDLLDENPDSFEVQNARQEMLDHPQVQKLLDDLGMWPDPPLKRHNDANHPLHKLSLLADFGVVATDPGMDPILERVLANQSPEGPFQIVMNLHPRFGGRSGDHLVWMLCDAPMVLYALIKMGLAAAPQVQAAGEYLMDLVRENGWPCAATPDLGKFKGPGKRENPCPYANLVMLKALAAHPKWRTHAACKIGTDTLLDLWTRRRAVKPFLFAMGTHFGRLKAPLIWYDLLHILDVLTQFPWTHNDPRLGEMISILMDKSDEMGRFTPESVWMAWKDWDFGQKKVPSYWLTLTAQNIINRRKDD
jgi:hypothetical protein